MGVNGLWKAISPAGADFSLEEILVLLGFTVNRYGDHRIIVGIDTNILMAQCNAVKRTAHGASPLKILFYKLCKFLRLPGTFVFVFDGKERPKLKNGRYVPCNEEPSWYGPCQYMIKTFGFFVHVAPGEAEAELAHLNRQGIVDYVMSWDSDIFVFGAIKVIRCMSAQKKTKSREAVKATQILFEKDKIEHHEGVTLSQGGLLLFALFAGGDYSTGVSGFGSKIAHALAKCGFGDTLYDGCMHHDGLARRAFLKSWLEGVQIELRTNSQRHLSSCEPALAKNICEGLLPRNEVIDLYIHPITSFSTGHEAPKRQDWDRVIEPDISALAMVAAQHLSWSTAAEIIKNFHGNVWEGIFLRMVFSPSRIINHVSMVVTRDEQAAEMLELKKGIRKTERKCKISSWYRVTISTTDFCHEIATSMGNGVFFIPPEQKTEVRVWVPQVYFPKAIIPFKRGFKPLRSDPFCVESTVGVFTPSPSPLPEPIAAALCVQAQRHSTVTQAMLDAVDAPISDDEILDNDTSWLAIGRRGNAGRGSNASESVDLDLTMDEDDNGMDEDDDGIDKGMAAVMREYVVDENGVIDLTTDKPRMGSKPVIEVMDLTLE